MKIKYITILLSGTTCNGEDFSKNEIFEADEKVTSFDVCKHIGKLVYEELKLKEYNVFEVEAEYVCNKILKLRFQKRGTFTDKKGIKHSSLHCVFANFYGDFIFKQPDLSKIKPKDLRCINQFGNNYKKYIIEIDENNNLLARYGSIDVPVEKCKVVNYEPFMYWILYYEKLSKGYEDMSFVLKDTLKSASGRPEDRQSDWTITNASEELYKMLYDYSKNIVTRTLVSQVVTRRQVDKATSVLDDLKTKKTVKGFNTALQKLMVISPRKRNPMQGDTVKQYLAETKDDFANIISFEEDLINAMEALVINDDVVETKKENAPSFNLLDIEVYEANEKQVEEVKQFLEPSFINMIHKIYRVKPLKQEKNFAKYCKLNNIKTLRKFWHGSTNGNWFSIVSNSLTIPKKATNGRMFGDGIYFAPSTDKSFGYTSYYNSRWANGKSNIGIMGLYTTAYGNPYHPDFYGARCLTEDGLKNQGYNCCHARSSDTGLRKDEVIFYNPNAVVLNYIVLFK